MRMVDVPELRRDALPESPKEQALKVLEEAAELFAACENVERGDGGAVDIEDEAADVVTSVMSLAIVAGIDLNAALFRCAERNMERGRL